MLGDTPLPQNVIDALERSGGDACENLHYLGKRTVTKTLDGIRIVALGGSLDPSLSTTTSKDSYSPIYSEGDVKALRGANNADILITSQWPEGIQEGSRTKPDFESEHKPLAKKSIADLCTALRPRYFFSTSSVNFYEREPFTSPPSEGDESALYVTRFISLAAFGNTQKQKWIYAFTIDPSGARPTATPAGTTASPFAIVQRKRTAPSNGGFQRFSDDTRHDRRSNKRQRQPLDASQCFFCISNPNIAQHLITSIGDEAYLTTAKGPLSERDTYPDLGFPCHILIIPMAHAPVLSAIPDPESRQGTIAEMEHYRTALHDMLKKRARGRLGAVTWEVSLSTGMHTHWQFLPMPVEMLSKGLVETAFKVQAENEQYPSLQPSEGHAKQNEANDSFKLWLWWQAEDGTESHKAFTIALDSSFRFDMQFGRRVLAKLLDLEGRSHWRDCGQTEAEETEDAEAFKKSFEVHDFAA